MSRFIINKGTNEEFKFKIKQDGSTEPLTLVDGDTFTALLYLKETDTLVATITETDTSNGVITQTDNTNGEITLLFKSAFTGTLVKERGNKEDRYYEKPTYSLVVTCNTANQGIFNIRVPDVFIG